MNPIPQIPSWVSQPVNERQRPLNKTNIINFSQVMADNFMVQHAWFYDEERKITLCIRKELGTNYSLDTIRENNGRRPYLNEHTEPFKAMVERYSTPEYGRQPMMYVGYAQSPNFNTEWQPEATLLLATTSIERMAEDVVEFLLPLVPVKKLSTAERMKKEREPLSFSGLIVQKYEATTYKNDVVFWQDFYASTDSFSKVTLKHLRSLREKFVCDVRLDRVGTVNLYKLFVWDHVDSKGYLLNDEYCFEVFGLSGLKLGLTKNEILNAKNRR